MENLGSVGALILAAGQSRRMEGVDKTFAPILGKPLILHTLEVFVECSSINRIALVLSENNFEAAKALVEEGRIPDDVVLCLGGSRRQDSAARGLSALGEHDWIVVHDGARPCLDPCILKEALKQAQCHGSAVVAVPVTDTIKRADSQAFVSGTITRDGLWAVQTPQIFPYSILKQAYNEVYQDVTDDASMVERLGIKVKLVPGSHDNLKVTSPRDLEIAEMVLARRQSTAIR